MYFNPKSFKAPISSMQLYCIMIRRKRENKFYFRELHRNKLIFSHAILLIILHYNKCIYNLIYIHITSKNNLMVNVLKFYDYLLIHESKRESLRYFTNLYILLNASDSILIYFDVFHKKKFTYFQ